MLLIIITLVFYGLNSCTIPTTSCTVCCNLVLYNSVKVVFIPTGDKPHLGLTFRGPEWAETGIYLSLLTGVAADGAVLLIIIIIITCLHEEETKHWLKSSCKCNKMQRFVFKSSTKWIPCQQTQTLWFSELFSDTTQVKDPLSFSVSLSLWL